MNMHDTSSESTFRRALTMKQQQHPFKQQPHVVAEATAFPPTSIQVPSLLTLMKAAASPPPQRGHNQQQASTLTNRLRLATYSLPCSISKGINGDIHCQRRPSTRELLQQALSQSEVFDFDESGGDDESNNDNGSFTGRNVTSHHRRRRRQQHDTSTAHHHHQIVHDMNDSRGFSSSTLKTQDRLAQ